MAQRSTQRTDFSQPPDYRTYSPEVTSLRSNLPVHRSCAHWACDVPVAYLTIIKEKSPVVKGIFSVFHEIFRTFSAVPHRYQKIAVLSAVFQGFRVKQLLFAPILCQIAIAGRRNNSGGLLLSRSGRADSFNKPRPSRCRWCTSCRTRGTRPRCRSAPAACSGR